VLPPNTNIEIQRWYSDAVISAINSESVRRTYQDNQLFIKESDLGPVVMKQDITDLTRKWSTFISTIDKSQ
jgi:tripartite-type tricarboxylate transporter receptor subunit TctC